MVDAAGPRQHAGPYRLLPISMIAMPPVAGLVSCWAVSFPGGDLGLWLLGLALSVLAGLILITVGTISLVIFRSGLAALIIGVVALVGLFAVARTDLPLRARFGLHQGEFTRVAQLRPDDPGACPDRIGSYRIKECSRFGSGLVFRVESSSFPSMGAGFAQLPDGPAGATPEGVDVSYQHLTGAWYTYWAQWK